MTLQIKNNKTLWFSLGSIMFTLTSMLMLMVVSRVSGVQAVGEFGISYAVVQLLYIVGLFGVNHYQMTDYKKKYSFGSYALIKLVTSLLMLLICAALIVFFFFSFERTMYTLLLTLYMLINSIAELYQSLFFQVDRIELSGRSLFFRTFLSFITFSIILYVTSSIISALISAILVNITLLFFMAVIPARKLIEKNEFQSGYKDCRSLFLSCIPLCVSLFLMAIVLNATKYVIDYNGNEIMQGYYNIIFLPAQAIALLSGFVFKPQLIKYSSFINDNDHTSFYRLLFRQLFLIGALAITGAVLGWFLGPGVIGFLFAADLSAYSDAIAIIIAGGGFFAVSSLLLNTSNSAKKLFHAIFCDLFSIAT
jgi:O-antigen/teichoic acid export membrane protein